MRLVVCGLVRDRDPPFAAASASSSAWLPAAGSFRNQPRYDRCPWIRRSETRKRWKEAEEGGRRLRYINHMKGGENEAASYIRFACLTRWAMKLPRLLIKRRVAEPCIISSTYFYKRLLEHYLRPGFFMCDRKYDLQGLMACQRVSFLHGRRGSS